jgi:hypothetical protein
MSSPRRRGGRGDPPREPVLELPEGDGADGTVKTKDVDFGASQGRYDADAFELPQSPLRDAAGERGRFYFRVQLRPGDRVLRLNPR